MGGSKMNVEDIVRSYYSAYEEKNWEAIESLLADNFTFTSPNDDDHIDIPTYKARCWPQAEFTERFELESVLRGDNEAFIKYLCTTTKGTSFRNVEYFRFAGRKICSVEVYFGGRLGYPTASVTGRPR
jgi:ketosteroid isomerase-like protein